MKRVLIVLLVLSIAVTAYAVLAGAGVGYVRPMHPQVNTVGLVAHYKLWDGLMTTGKVFDYSLNGNDATLIDTDTPITLVPKYPGFNFDGSNDYIDIGDPFESLFQGSFSISMWVKPTDGRPPGSSVHMFGVSTSSEEDCVWIVLGTNGLIQAKYAANNNSCIYYGSSAQFADGQIADFHHIVYVADSTISDIEGIILYFDGVLIPPVHPTINRGNTSGITFADFRSTLNPFISAENTVGGAANWYNGLIDSVMFFDVAKTATEVRNIYEVTRWRYSK